jgi:hypothetical protein
MAQDPNILGINFIVFELVKATNRSPSPTPFSSDLAHASKSD